MDMQQLQAELVRLGCYSGAVDGAYGPDTRAAILKALTGPGYVLDDAGVKSAAAEIGSGVTEAQVRTSWAVECTGRPFVDGRPTILFEPHRFSRATGGRFDASHPHISSATWNRDLYPATQQGRYDQVLEAVGLDVDAGFASASYGGGQILGENYRLCDAASPFAFAWRQAQSADDQIYAYTLFVKNAGLAPKLAACRPNDPVSCQPFCRGFNGTAYAVNHYDVHFAQQLGVEMKVAG